MSGPRFPRIIGPFRRRLHADVPKGLDLLATRWTGQAHDAHRDATLNSYQPHLAALRDHAQNLAYKDWQSQDAQQRFNDRLVIIFGWALVALGGFLIMLALNVLFEGDPARHRDAAGRGRRGDQGCRDRAVHRLAGLGRA